MRDQVKQHVRRALDEHHVIALVVRLHVQGAHTLACRVKWDLVHALVPVTQHLAVQLSLGCRHDQRALGRVAHHAELAVVP